MRGPDEQTQHIFSYLSPEQQVPADHPLRAIRALTDEALRSMSPRLERLYATTGRPSIPPEQLLRALLLQVLYTVRSERLLMEELNSSLLFRWFVGLNMDDPVWHPTTFTKNRDRLLGGNVAAAFFDAIQQQASAAGLLSDEHFTVDGTQLEAWASRRVSDPVRARTGRRRMTLGIPRSTSAANADGTTPPSRLRTRTPGYTGRVRDARRPLAYLSHALLDNRNGLVANVCVTAATGPAEREAATWMLDASAPPGSTVGADKGYDAARLVDELHALDVAPHIARKVPYSAIDIRTTFHRGYEMSQRKRKLVEQVFVWLKTVGGLRKLRHRGGPLVDWIVTFAAAAYNLVRLRTLVATCP